ncbi:MarR family transcriptional regulator [Streptomyces sp. NPDC097619]|uniref:MarR family winged helix-turn-helix transcriptional regulator n=1 Tax=Streptomyces sp. NPDC097619 TaxID=3157228 RepID=UPI00331A8B27
MPETDSPPHSLPSDDPIGLQSFAVLLRRMNAEFNRIAQEFAQAQGLHLTDVQALIAVLDADASEDGPMTPGRLRARLDLTSGAMTACLDRLERSGHLHRVRSAEDRRVVHLHYAQAARKVARDYFRPLAQGTDRVRSRFTEQELRVAARFLAELNGELDHIGR